MAMSIQLARQSRLQFAAGFPPEGRSRRRGQTDTIRTLVVVVAVGKDADDIGATPDFLVEPLLGVIGPDLAPDLLGEGGEGQQVGPGGFEVVGDLGQLVGQGASMIRPYCAATDVASG